MTNIRRISLQNTYLFLKTLSITAIKVYGILYDIRYGIFINCDRVVTWGSGQYTCAQMERKKTSIYTGLFKTIVGVLTTWPPRSPDATPCHFLVWGYVKDQVYVPPLPASNPELKVRIRTAIETITADML
jgi:hypothetical protein